MQMEGGRQGGGRQSGGSVCEEGGGMCEGVGWERWGWWRNVEPLQEREWLTW